MSIERVHIRPKANECGIYKNVVMRVFGSTNHIRMELNQGLAVLRRAAELYSQLRKHEKVEIENVSIIIGNDEAEFERKYVMPNIKPVKIVIPIEILDKIINSLDKITEAAAGINANLDDMFEEVNRVPIRSATAPNNNAARNNSIVNVNNGSTCDHNCACETCPDPHHSGGLTSGSGTAVGKSTGKKSSAWFLLYAFVYLSLTTPCSESRWHEASKFRPRADGCWKN